MRATTPRYRHLLLSLAIIVAAGGVRFDAVASRPEALLRASDSLDVLLLSLPPIERMALRTESAASVEIVARGDSIVIEGFTFQVLRADSRKVHSLLVEKPKETE